MKDDIYTALFLTLLVYLSFTLTKLVMAIVGAMLDNGYL
jgi:hypothetical protein